MSKLVDYFAAAAIIGGLVLAVVRLDRFAMRETAGAAVVNDGDSITIGSERVRLRGIDAPELGQSCTTDGRDYACGRRSRESLAGLIADASVACEGWERDRYDRLLAVCRAGGRELNLGQVEAGWALAYGGYEDAEQRARQAGAGLWAGTFERPRDYRDRQGDAGEAPHDWLGVVFNMIRELFRGG